MAPSFCFHHNLYWNFLLNNHSNNEPTGDLLRTFIEGNNTHTFTSAILHFFILASVFDLFFINESFKLFIKAYLKNEN